MATVVLVQHGEKERRPGDPGLTPHGPAQAAQVAAVFAESGRPAAIYSSPLKRAAETAALIGQRFALDVHYDSRLRERINWEGGPFSSFVADWERSTLERDFVPASGDSSRQAAERMLEAIGEMADSHAAATVVVVTHGGVTVDVLRDLLGDDALLAAHPALLAGGVPPCALTTLIRTGNAWRVAEVAADRHRSLSTRAPW